MRVRFFKSNRHAFFGVTKHLHGFVQGHIWLAPLLAVLPFLMYGILLWGAFHGIVRHHTLLAVISILTLVIHYVALLLTRPGNKFSAVVALAFPLMSIPFAASCLRATYLLMAKGTFQWRGRNTDLSDAHSAVAEPSVAPEPAVGRVSQQAPSPPSQ